MLGAMDSMAKKTAATEVSDKTVRSDVPLRPGRRRMWKRPSARRAASSSGTAGRSWSIKKWDERKLAYEIKGKKRGMYIIAYFTAPGDGGRRIERDVNLSEDVLRVLVTKADHLNEKEMEAVEPQPISREERPSWERAATSNAARIGRSATAAATVVVTAAAIAAIATHVRLARRTRAGAGWASKD